MTIVKFQSSLWDRSAYHGCTIWIWTHPQLDVVKLVILIWTIYNDRLNPLSLDLCMNLNTNPQRLQRVRALRPGSSSGLPLPKMIFTLKIVPKPQNLAAVEAECCNGWTGGRRWFRESFFQMPGWHALFRVILIIRLGLEGIFPRSEWQGTWGGRLASSTAWGMDHLGISIPHRCWGLWHWWHLGLSSPLPGAHSYAPWRLKCCALTQDLGLTVGLSGWNLMACDEEKVRLNDFPVLMWSSSEDGETGKKVYQYL